MAGERNAGGPGGRWPPPRPPGAPVDDGVTSEDTTVLPAHDITYQVGTLAADSYTFFIPVADNRMDVRLVPRAKSDKPVVNALRHSGSSEVRIVAD